VDEPPTNPQSPAAALPVEQLVARLLAAGPEEASLYAEEIIRRFAPALRHAWRQGAFHVEYQDFVQDVFVRLFGRLRSLRNPKAFPGFLYQIARSQAASHGRRPADSATEALADLQEPADRFDEHLLAGIFVRSYLEELSPREREVAKMSFLEEESSEDIAKILGLTPSAVRATKARAVSRLRKILLQEARALEREAKKA
jgi:RNA polymerase sigma factor (sigma-70 family)